MIPYTCRRHPEYFTNTCPNLQGILHQRSSHTPSNDANHQPQAAHKMNERMITAYPVQRARVTGSDSNKGLFYTLELFAHIIVDTPPRPPFRSTNPTDYAIFFGINGPIELRTPFWNILRVVKFEFLCWHHVELFSRSRQTIVDLCFYFSSTSFLEWCWHCLLFTAWGTRVEWAQAKGTV